MKVLGSKLIFISQINRNGSGSSSVSDEYIKLLEKEKFKLMRLSITNDTYIAHGFNSFVVKKLHINS